MSATDKFFSDGNLYRNLFLWRKLNFWRKYCSDIYFCLTETCFCDKNSFLWQKLVSFTESFSVTVTCFCDRNLICQNTFFWAFFTWFPGWSFREKWEFPVSRIIMIITLWSLAPPPPPPPPLPKSDYVTKWDCVCPKTRQGRPRW